MKHTLPLSLIAGVLTTLATTQTHAVTTFLATNNSFLNDATNWDNGLPSNGNPGTTTADGTLNANSGNGGDNFFVNSSVTTGAFTFAAAGAADRLHIGDGGAGGAGSFTVNSGGALTAIGSSQDVRIGFNGGSGSLIFENGSSIDTRKAMQVLNGTLSFGFNVSTLQNGIQNTFSFGAGGTLQFDVSAGFANHTIQGNTVPIVLTAGSSLQLDFAAAPTTGATFKLVDDVESYTGTFTNVTGNGLAANQSLELTYGLGGDGLVATVVPEPSSAALLGLSGLGILLRRRR